MNEREIEHLLKSYGDSVPPIQRKPQKSLLRWPRFATAGLATAVVAGIAVVGLWPHDAVAGSVARMHRALSDAKTMEYTISMKIPSGWHPYLRAFYENGVWRYDTRLGTNLEYTAVMRDGMELIDFKNLDHASLDVAPPTDDTSSNWQTALDFAKKSIDTGNTEIQRSVKVHEHDPVDGRPAYEITMERPSDHYLAKIVVDKQTDLPIESSIVADDQRPGFEGVQQQTHTVFQFNKPIDPQRFSLDPKNRVVIRMNDARDRLKQMWRTPLGSVDGAEARAATITKDGTLWLATTAKGDRPMLPDALVDAAGRKYVRGGDVSPAAQLNIKAYDDVFGKPIYVTAFAPLPGSGSKLIDDHVGLAFAQIHRNERAAEPWLEKGLRGYQIVPTNSVTVQFIRRDPSFVSKGRLLEGEMDRREILTVVPTYESGNLPSYFPMLGLDRPNVSLIQSIWRAKAEVLESSKQYELAAQAYAQVAKARYEWVKYSAFQPMLDQARCYRLMGQPERADQIAEAAAVLKASRER